MEHKDEPVEEVISRPEEEIAIVSSYRRASRILNEIAIAGHYKAKEFVGEFIVFTRDMNGNREEVTAEKLSDRNYRIVKRIITHKYV